MVKSLLLLSFLVLGEWALAQSSLTRRQVYDFDVNDEFQTHVLNIPPNANRWTILNKRVSANNDTVVYTFAFNSYTSTYTSTPSPHLIYNFSTGVDSVRYTKLDSLINYVGWPTDTCSVFHDSTYVSSTYCNALIYEYMGGTAMCFEGQTTSKTYGKGLGDIAYEYQYPAMFTDNHWELFYYHKSVAGTTCGTADLTSVTEHKEGYTNEMILSPNPARSSIKVNSGIEQQEITVMLLDITGKILMSRKESRGNFSVDVGDLEEGVYFVQIKDASGVRSKRIIVQH